VTPLQIFRDINKWSVTLSGPICAALAGAPPDPVNTEVAAEQFRSPLAALENADFLIIAVLLAPPTVVV